MFSVLLFGNVFDRFQTNYCLCLCNRPTNTWFMIWWCWWCTCYCPFIVTAIIAYHMKHALQDQQSGCQPCSPSQTRSGVNLCRWAIQEPNSKVVWRLSVTLRPNAVNNTPWLPGITREDSESCSSQPTAACQDLPCRLPRRRTLQENILWHHLWLPT